MSETSFQVLWHRVVVEGPDGHPFLRPPASGPPTWPVETLLDSRYRVEPGSGGWTVWQDGDALVRDVEEPVAWSELVERIGARAFEIAARRRWIALAAPVLDIDGGLVAVVGPEGERHALLAALGTVGVPVASRHGLVAHDGRALPVPFDGRSSLAHLDLRPLRGVLVWCPGLTAGDPVTAVIARAMMSVADRTVTRMDELVRGVSLLIRGLEVAGVGGSAQDPHTGWYGFGQGQRLGANGPSGGIE